MKQDTQQHIMIYKASDGTAQLEVKLQDETVWLSLNQIADLFDTDKSGISRHIRNIYNEGELSRKATVAKIATVQNESGREVTRDIEYYHLDMILSVGYRVNSRKKRPPIFLDRNEANISRAFSGRFTRLLTKWSCIPASKRKHLIFSILLSKTILLSMETSEQLLFSSLFS